MSPEAFLACLVVASASYRVTRLIVLDSLLDEPRMWTLRRLAPRSRVLPGRGVRNYSRLPKTRTKIAEGLQCTFCVGVWITVAVAALWHLGGWIRGPIIVAGICGLQALLHMWEGE